jgi:feruloyl-CoA synthase
MSSLSYRSRALFAPRDVEISKRADGCLILRSSRSLPRTVGSVCEYLPGWAREAPNRKFLAERTASGEWRSLTYAEAWNATRSLGEALLSMGAKPGDRIAILSGNSIAHGLVMLAGMSIGCCVSPISPNYSLMQGGQARLAEIGRVLKPTFVFAQSGQAFSAARAIPEFSSANWITAEKSEQAVSIEQLMTISPSSCFDKAFEALTAETIAKILFTSGSTGIPKGVINTHGMLVSAVEMAGQLIESPEPVQVEWMPWHHTMGGNSIFNSIMRNGGTHYIDNGRPTPDAFEKSLDNLREISPTSMLNVPSAYAMLVDAMERDEKLRVTFFKELRFVTYGGAAIPGAVITRFQALAEQTIGARIPILSGYGATEAAPTICLTHWPSEQAGEIGLPAPGLELKLLPIDDRYELRIKGPNVTPGYYGRPELNAAAFDEEGYYKVGDAVTFLNPSHPEQGLLFAGRISESFKLANGTWVVPDQLRMGLIKAARGALLDIVVAGENRDSVTALLWASTQGAAKYLRNRENLKDPPSLARDPGLIEHLQQTIGAYNRECGSSSRVSAFAMIIEPPSLQNGELTDKGSINQKAALKNRAQIIERLYRHPLGSEIFEPAR